MLFEFNAISSFKALYSTLVQPVLDYTSFFLNPSTAAAISMIKKIQRKLFRHATYKFKIAYSPHDYSAVLIFLSIERFSDRRHIINLKFLVNLLIYKIDCPDILSLISFNIPSHATRFPI